MIGFLAGAWGLAKAAVPFVTSRAGITAILIGGAVILYEGVPIIGDIPFIDRVPYVNEIVLGRVDKARLRGEAAERAAWEERLRVARAEHEARLEQKQKEIDEIERHYLASRSDHALSLRALEEQLEQAEKENEGTGGNRCVAIPSGVSKQLDAIR